MIMAVIITVCLHLITDILMVIKGNLSKNHKTKRLILIKNNRILNF